MQVQTSVCFGFSGNEVDGDFPMDKVGRMDTGSFPKTGPRNPPLLLKLGSDFSSGTEVGTF